MENISYLSRKVLHLNKKTKLICKPLAWFTDLLSKFPIRPPKRPS